MQDGPRRHERRGGRHRPRLAADVEQVRAKEIAALIVGEQQLVQDLSEHRRSLTTKLLKERAQGVAFKTIAHEILTVTRGEATAANLDRIEARLRQRVSKRAPLRDRGSRIARGPGEPAASRCGSKGRSDMYRRRTVEEWFENAPNSCERPLADPDDPDGPDPEVDIPDLIDNEVDE